jgi:hypothetical protein
MRSHKLGLLVQLGKLEVYSFYLLESELECSYTKFLAIVRTMFRSKAISQVVINVMLLDAIRLILMLLPPGMEVVQMLLVSSPCT